MMEQLPEVLAPPEAISGRPTVLLVDDNHHKLHSMASVLSELPLDVLSASSAKEALKLLLRRQDFAVILLDVNMPDMDGFELAEMIRRRPRFEYTPLIFVTSISTSEAERARGYGMGAVDYIFLPVVPEVLRAKVSALVDLHRKTREVERQAEQMKQLNSQLESQLQHIEQLNHQLALSNRELEGFTYSVSYDLRAPLGSVANYVGLLREEFADKLTGKGKKYMDFVESGLDRADKLIQGFLDLTQVARAPLLPREIDLVEVVQGVLPSLPDYQRVDWAMPPQIPVVADPGLLSTALSQLLSNAIKFTAKVAKPKVEIGFLEASKTCFVKDNGTGFPADFADRIFLPFQRQRLIGDAGGAKIGLAIAHRAIARHGGSIWAEGKPQSGATFYFKLKPD
jgi:two-component system sensor histidine kinase/response regulator